MLAKHVCLGLVEWSVDIKYLLIGSNSAIVQIVWILFLKQYNVYFFMIIRITCIRFALDTFLYLHYLKVYSKKRVQLSLQY